MTAFRFLSGQTGNVRTRDGRRLHYTTNGSGPVPVVLEAGMAASSLSWRPTYEALAERCTVVAYDRGGIGESDDDPRPRTLARLTEDLADLVSGLQLRPALLVGHSFGGLVVRNLAAVQPEIVRGVVLVDPTDETVAFLRSGLIRAANRSAYAVMGVLARLGMLYRLQQRGAGGALLDRATAGLDVAHRDAYGRAFFSARTMRGGNAEMKHLLAALDTLTGRARPLAVPTTVISAGRAGKREAAMREQILQAHADLAQVSGGRHRVVADSGHYLQIEAPEAIVEEVVQLSGAMPQPSRTMAT